jgi:molybdopterin-guanine dinucleotide biosynthesis protein A
MGRDKAGLPVEGHLSALHRQLALLATLRPRELFVSCRPDQRLPASSLTIAGRAVRRIHDSGTDGPLAGIAAALAACRTEFLLVLAVDLVRMSPHVLRRIVGAADATRGIGAVPRVDGEIEPLASVLPVALATDAAARLIAGERGLRAFLASAAEAGRVRWWNAPTYDAHAFVNWNDRADRVPPRRASG